MADLSISDAEIEGVERLLLPKGRHFDDEARAVIRRWETVDVVACPGSGKTTVLLAKLKLLADRMPLEGGVGACVLSHTNVAVDEIGSRFPSHASRLLGHPNYVGTIQSFVDRFLVAPYFMERIEGDGYYVPNQNVYVDSPTGVRIEFDTVHGVKGETHDATLYLETETHGASDIKRVLQMCGIGRKTRISDLHRYCRKVVYVGLSRPRKLLCVAVRSETYEFGKDAINGWEIDDMRH